MPIRNIDDHPARPLAITGGRIYDADAEMLGGVTTIVVRDGLIADVLPGRRAPAGVDQLDITGRIVLPGLIDAHVHATQSGSHAEVGGWDGSYLAARAAVELERMLRRGFTTVRDMGGAETGLAQAVRERLLTAPRLLAGGPIFAPTGGHGLTRVVDGEVDIRRALREQFRDGADHVKLTVSGGVASKMRIDSLGFSRGELLAAVDEARLAHRYVAAHAYTAEAVNRALECGVRTIEHGTHIDEESIRLLIELDDVHLVPTTVGYWSALNGSATLGSEQREVVEELIERGLESIVRADQAGVSIGYGTDLNGTGHRFQLEEIRLRARVQRPEAILRSLTVVGAAIVNGSPQLGCVRAGFAADLLIIDSDPREDLDAIADPDRPRLVVTAGEVLS